MQPVDKPLYDSIKKKYASMKHSAYKSGLIVKQYKKALGKNMVIKNHTAVKRHKKD